MEVFRGLHCKFRGLFDKVDRELREDTERAYGDLEAQFHCVEQVLHKTALPSIAPRVKYSLQRFCDVSTLLQVLRQPTGDGDTSQSKLQVWQDLKVLSFARAFAAVVSLVIVSMQMRLMLTVLSRQLFLERAMEGTKRGACWPVLDMQAQEFFLSLVEKGFGTRGVEQLVGVVKSITKKSVGDLALSKSTNAEELRLVLRNLRKQTVPTVVSGDWGLGVAEATKSTDDTSEATNSTNDTGNSIKENNWDTNLLPSDDDVRAMWRARVETKENAASGDSNYSIKENTQTADLVLSMVTEIRAVVRSPGFAMALTSALENAWDVFEQRATHELFVQKEITQMPVAKLVPALSNLSGDVLKKPESLFAAVASSPKVVQLTREMW